MSLPFSGTSYLVSVHLVEWFQINWVCPTINPSSLTRDQTLTSLWTSSSSRPASGPSGWGARWWPEAASRPTRWSATTRWRSSTWQPRLVAAASPGPQLWTWFLGDGLKRAFKKCIQHIHLIFNLGKARWKKIFYPATPSTSMPLHD